MVMEHSNQFDGKRELPRNRTRRDRDRTIPPRPMSAQVGEETEDPTGVPIHADDGAALGSGQAPDLGDRFRELFQAIHRVLRVEVVVHRLEERVSCVLYEGLDLAAGPETVRGPRGLDRSA